MKLTSIETSIGAALLADLTDSPIHPLGAIPKDWGLILWGRCDRTQLLILALSLDALWIADYIPNSKEAIVILSKKEGLAPGNRIKFNSAVVDALCPKCSSSNYVSNGLNYLCKSCGRQWRKNSKRQRGRPQQEISRKLVEDINLLRDLAQAELENEQHLV